MFADEQTSRLQARWLAAARIGNGDAYGALFMAYHAALVRYAWPLVGSQEDAEDVVHDAFLKSWQRLDRFDERRGTYGTWIFAVTRNCCLDRLRARKRRPTAQAPDPDAQADWLADDAPDPEHRAMQQDRQSAMMVRLAMLPPAYRETLVLFYWNDLSVHEIAQVTGTSESNVKSRLSRGRSRLADILRREMGVRRDHQPSLDALDMLLAGSGQV